MLKKYGFPVFIAVATACFIYFFPLANNLNQADANSFRSLFGPVAFVSYMAYLLFDYLFIKVVKNLKLSPIYIYAAHVIGFVAGYSFLFLAFNSIANGGIDLGI